MDLVWAKLCGLFSSKSLVTAQTQHVSSAGSAGAAGWFPSFSFKANHDQDDTCPASREGFVASPRLRVVAVRLLLTPPTPSWSCDVVYSYKAQVSSHLSQEQLCCISQEMVAWFDGSPEPIKSKPRARGDGAVPCHPGWLCHAGLTMCSTSVRVRKARSWLASCCSLSFNSFASVPS